MLGDDGVEAELGSGNFTLGEEDEDEEEEDVSCGIMSKGWMSAGMRRGRGLPIGASF